MLNTDRHLCESNNVKYYRAAEYVSSELPSVFMFTSFIFGVFLQSQRDAS